MFWALYGRFYEMVIGFPTMYQVRTCAFMYLRIARQASESDSLAFFEGAVFALASADVTARFLAKGLGTTKEYSVCFGSGFVNVDTVPRIEPEMSSSIHSDVFMFRSRTRMML